MDKKLTFFDCFSGIGGFRMAFESEGFIPVGFCEKDKHATKLYKAFYNTEGEYYAEDATKIITREMPDFDIFCGGFPCQSFSIAGKRQGFEDTRGTLFFEIIRICSEKRPRYIVLENVRGLFSHESGKTFQTILKLLSGIGYSVQWQLLNSKFFSVPHNRQRVFIVATLGKIPTGKIFPIGEMETICTKPNATEEEVRNIAQTLIARQYDNWKGNFIRYPNGDIRRLTPLELFRLQDFPDDIIKKAYEIGISDKQLDRMSGNSVTVSVVKEIARRIKRVG